jgi:glycosyltransferase involved in cell wall biosynthesis
MSASVREATEAMAAMGGVLAPVVDVVLPTHNEAAGLECSLRRLHGYLTDRFPFGWRITIVDNGSSDATPGIARRLAAELPGVEARVLAEPGRGRALRAAWLASDAEIVAYMDCDLSTDLDGLLPLVAPLISGHSDVAIGSRLAPGARVRRGPKREVISRCYNAILRLALRTTFRDAQCGFKAVRASTARRLLADVEDDGWFFDTELLVRAQRAGLRIVELPVDWVDDPDSRVRILRTAWADLRGVGRLLVTGRFGRPLRFAVIGALSTLAYLLIYLSLQPDLGPWGANFVALALTAVGNTAANRRYTFGVTGREGQVRHHLQGAVAFAAGLAASSAGLGLLHLVVDSPTAVVEAFVALGCGIAGTVVRYLLFRNWIFAPHQEPPPPVRLRPASLPQSASPSPALATIPVRAAARPLGQVRRDP